MTTNPLDAIQARVDAFAGRGTPGRRAPEDRAVLLKAVRAVEAVVEDMDALGGNLSDHWAQKLRAAIREALG